MVRDPDLFVFDEPLSSLDAQIRSQARGELRELLDRTKITTLYVTHDQVEALGLADRVAVMHRGRLHQVGTPQALYDDPLDLFVAGFIGDPPMNLFTLDNVIIGARPEDIVPIDGGDDGDVALTLDIEVEHHEFLGVDWLIYGTVCGGVPQHGHPPRVITRARQGGRPGQRTGEVHKFVVRKANARYFDRESGRRTAPVAGTAP
jgi:multiple sugar transport system ATP-binding protein